MKSDKKQSAVMIGIVFLFLAGIMLYVTLKAPRVYEGEDFSYSITSTTEKETVSVHYPLNLNTASAEELAEIDGLSMDDALAIVMYREKIGAYSNISEIMNIKGIGQTTYYKVLPYLEI